ncbi:zinc ABC transporter ATP-binding protein ZnuC [Photobacterium aphoticum]|uniref:Zinc ABC transporter ATP-binding protein ZnuC n=1 Tax=Photobacterium aphoticum TaxID=754436 RepID=A0A090QT41_9GAMM|nr:zinc ABC transporter ATP-binding protein ZnuC [Photobacterium aphoticum]
MTTLVELQTVTVTFGERHVLDQVSLKLERGQITTLIGPNGAGKSTLVKVITGLQNPPQVKCYVRKGYVSVTSHKTGVKQRPASER